MLLDKGGGGGAMVTMMFLWGAWCRLSLSLLILIIKKMYSNYKSCMDLSQEFPVSLAPINGIKFSFKHCPQWSLPIR
jgi:hypothetical protein